MWVLKQSLGVVYVAVTCIRHYAGGTDEGQPTPVMFHQTGLLEDVTSYSLDEIDLFQSVNSAETKPELQPIAIAGHHIQRQNGNCTLV